MDRSFASKLKMRLKGDWKNLYFSPRETVEHPFGEMVGELLRFPEEYDWARYYVFAGDPIAGAIPPEEADKLCAQAVQCGKKRAQALRRQFPDKSVREICQAMGVRVEEDLSDASGAQVRFAEFVEPELIRINPECVKRAEEQCAQLEAGNPLPEQTPGDVLMAHELYHFLESKEPELFTAAYRHKTGRAALFGPARVITLGEIGAGAFAKELAQLKTPAYVYDVIFTYCFHSAQAGRLYERIKAGLTRKGN